MSQNTPEPSQVQNLGLGRKYEDTPIGAAISLSILPRDDKTPFQFFSKPSTQSKKEVDLVESSVWRATEVMVGGLHKIFVDLMKVHPDIKHYTLRWLGLVIQGNASKIVEVAGRLVHTGNTLTEMCSQRNYLTVS